MKAIVATVTIFTNSNYFKFTEGESAKTLWDGNKIDIKVKIIFYFSYSGDVPYDGSAVDAVHRNHIAMEVIYSILATAGLVFTVVCFLFNLFFRNTK